GAPEIAAGGGIFDSGADAISYVNIGAIGQAGTLLQLLSTGNVTVQTNATGAGNGDITVADAISWASTNTLTLDAHRDVVVNAGMTGNKMTFIVGRDLVPNANLTDSGTSTLTIQNKNNGDSFGIAGAVGTLDLSVADLSRIV